MSNLPVIEFNIAEISLMDGLTLSSIIREEPDLDNIFSFIVIIQKYTNFDFTSLDYNVDNLTLIINQFCDQWIDYHELEDIIDDDNS